MNAKMEAIINVIIAVLAITAIFFSTLYAALISIAYLLIIAAYKYFYAPKKQL